MNERDSEPVILDNPINIDTIHENSVAREIVGNYAKNMKSNQFKDAIFAGIDNYL